MRVLSARFVSVALAAASLSFALAGSASAQSCPVPDNLSGGPCCATTQPNNPRVPNFKQTSLSICWKDCNVDNVVACEAAWSSPTPAGDCSHYSKRLRLKDTSGVVKWNGRVRFRYSRTWIETDNNGVERQIWRYLANGDLRPTAAAGTSPCPVPPCAVFNGNKVRYTGYVDYALDCSSGLQEFAWMLTHACDRVDHAPGFPRSGVYHPDRSYTFVGPAAGFVVGALNPVESGSSTLEAVRRISRVPGTIIDTCEFEEQVSHQIQPLQQLCLCGTATGPLQYVVSDLSVAGACGSTLTTNGGPYLPGFLSMAVGMWSDPTKFPGLEILRWNAGGYTYGDPCVGTVREEVFFGVTTIRGWPAKQVPTPIDPGLPLPTTFVDQGNSLQGMIGTTMNKPYRTDHVLNLNY